MADQKGTRNRRHQLLVMRRFQYNYVLTALVTILVILNLGISSAMLWFDLLISPADGALIGLSELLLVGIVAYLGLRKSHTIAGPVMVMERNLARVQDGDLSIRMRLRQTDRFQHSADAFNMMVESLEARVKDLRGAVARLREHTDSCPQILSVVEEIENHLSAFTTTGDRRDETGGDEND